MEHRCSGVGLMLAGAIVALIGLTIAISVTYAVPRHWTVFTIGVTLFVAGAARRALGASRGERPDSGASKV